MNRLRLAATVTAVAFGALACGSTEAQSAPEGAAGSAPAVDARAQRFAEVLHAAGVQVVDPTAVQLVPSICTLLAAGTPDAAIVANLAPVAAYLAAVNPGAGDTDSMAHKFLATARETYC